MTDRDPSTEPAPPVSYAAAVDELDALLADLERDDADIDALAERLARASVLIQFCRQRIEQAQVDIERIALELE